MPPTAAARTILPADHPLPDPLLAERVAACVGDRLRDVERTFDAELASDLAPVNRLVRHVRRFRGKMLRPTLVLLGGRACGTLSAAHVTIATVVELVHMATLVHDDVLDEAELRRKGATINHLRGNEAAVLLGDYLISHGYHLCSTLDSQEAARLIAATTNRVCEGELLQLENRGNLDLDEPTYLEMIRRKTAALTAACTRLGAMFADADAVTVERMDRYGLCLGTAFQIQDDLLDLLGEQRQVGKTLGLDIRKGKLTLPLIHFLRTAPAEHRALLRSLLSDGSPDATDRQERIRNLVMPSGSIAYARDRAATLVAEAVDALDTLADSEAKRLLIHTAGYVVARAL